MTLFGSDSPTIDLTRYRRWAYARRFNSGRLADLTGLPTGIRYHVSMNTGGKAVDLNAIDAWLTKWAHVMAGDFTLDHEVNLGNKGTPDMFRSNMHKAAPLLQGTGWRLVEVFSQYGELHKQPWTTWHSPDAAAQTWDAYVPASATSLPVDVAAWAAPSLRAIQASGLPGGLSEWGFPPAADPTGEDGARFAAQLGRLAKDQRWYVCSAWDNPATGTPGVPAGGYVLDGSTLVAWQSVVEVG